MLNLFSDNLKQIVHPFSSAVYDAQGNQVYKFRLDPLNPKEASPYITEDVSDINDSAYQQMPTDKMLDASRNDPIYNQN